MEIEEKKNPEPAEQDRINKPLASNAEGMPGSEIPPQEPAAEETTELPAQTQPEPAAEETTELPAQTPQEPAAEETTELPAQTQPEPAAEETTELPAQTQPEPAAEGTTELPAQTQPEPDAAQGPAILLPPEEEHLPVLPEPTPRLKQPIGRGNLVFFAGCLLLAVALLFNGTQLWRRYNMVNSPSGSLTETEESKYTAYLANLISSNPDLSAFMEAYQYVTENSTLNPDTAKLMDGAIEGMLAALDDKYAAYYDPETFSMKMDDSSGFYSGIGASVIENGGYITIVQPYEDSPAAAAGLLTGDQILAVDGVDVVGWSTDDAVTLVRGPVNTDVVLTIRRPGSMEDLQVTVTRATVETKTVTGSLSDDKIADIELTSFNDQTGKQLAALVEEFKAQGMTGLILDLRNNGGGTHTGVVESAQCLLPEGKIFSIVYANGYTDEEFSQLKERGFPMVVLINQYSASASEVLAGALQDSGVPLVGVQSYGKGVGQSSVNLSNGSGITFTTSNWYTRNGRQVADVGLTPDFIVVDAWFPLGTIDVAKLKPSDLSLLQYKLNALGFPVAAETEYAEATQNAVAAYQTSKGLQATGQLDLATVQNLNADCYVLLDGGGDPQYEKAREVLQGLLAAD
ncbi:MAG: PDZ domain-containing protein [Negativicutes bacterium]|nr:PDZ domain-containing protein [Negativicutes bacterium]